MANQKRRGEIFVVKKEVMSVTINIHPLSARVLSSLYGSEGVVMCATDPMFDLLSSKGNTLSATTTKEYTAPVNFLINEKLARQLANNPVNVAHRLFRYHKHLMCWYVATQVQVRGRGSAKAAIYDWMQLHRVSEDDYSSETLYKVFQRFGWNISSKNIEISGRLRNKTASILSPKKRAKWGTQTARQQTDVSDSLVELAIANFLAKYQLTFRAVPVKLPKHIRIYMYVTAQKLSYRAAATKLGSSCNGVHTATRAMQQRISRNIAIRDMVAEVLTALPV
jgi:hypothetical protein